MFWITFEVLMPGDFDLDICLQHFEDSRGFCLLQILINIVDNLVPVPSGIVLILLLYIYNIVLLLIRRIVHFLPKKSFITIYEAKIWCKIFKFVNLMSGVTIKFATCNYSRVIANLCKTITYHWQSSWPLVCLFVVFWSVIERWNRWMRTGVFCFTSQPVCFLVSLTDWACAVAACVLEWAAI